MADSIVTEKKLENWLKNKKLSPPPSSAGLKEELWRQIEKDGGLTFLSSHSSVKRPSFLSQKISALAASLLIAFGAGMWVSHQSLSSLDPVVEAEANAEFVFDSYNVAFADLSSSNESEEDWTVWDAE